MQHAEKCVCGNCLYLSMNNVLGVCPSHLLFDKIQVKECEDVNVIRSIKDYDITVDREMPEGVELIEKL